MEQSPSPFLRRLAGKTVEGGITHSAFVLPVAALLGLGAWGVFGRPGMLAAVVGGVLSHLLLDLFGQTGVQLFAPFSRAWIAFPPWERLRPHRGGPTEIALFTLGLGTLAALAVVELLPYAVGLVGAVLGGAP